MDTQILQRHFAECNLPITFVEQNPRSKSAWTAVQSPSIDDFFYVDVLGRIGQETFRMFVHPSTTIELLDKVPKMRHLLLHMQCSVQEQREEKRKILLGHDERQLFVVEPRRANSVQEALDSLKPPSVRQAERRNLKVIRQGDWFFIPARSNFSPSQLTIYRNEMLGGPDSRRFGVRVGNPHVAEEQVLSIEDRRLYRDGQWRVAGRSVRIWVQGKIRHDEHSTIELRAWHEAVQTGAESATNPMIGYFD